MKMSTVDDATLLKLAEAEILKEAKRAAIRHSTAGVSGWQPCLKANKMFLTNTILQTMASNRIMAQNKANRGNNSQKKYCSERKLLQKSKSTDRTNNFIYQKPKKFKEKPILSSKRIRKLDNGIVKSEFKHSKERIKVKEKFNKTSSTKT